MADRERRSSKTEDDTGRDFRMLALIRFISRLKIQTIEVRHQQLPR
jgi:hypothetical protein